MSLQALSSMLAAGLLAVAPGVAQARRGAGARPSSVSTRPCCTGQPDAVPVKGSSGANQPPDDDGVVPSAGQGWPIAFCSGST